MTTIPALFLGHGNPMNALETNAWTEAWRVLGSQMPRPRAVLSISAHWYLPGTHVTSSLQPRTIHDFGGFPQKLFEVQYPAPGAPELAERVRSLLGSDLVKSDETWGLDHGTWSVLVHLLPQADIPVVQVSIDETLSAQAHFKLAKKLRPLRDEGVLILGSGNVVHNLHAYAWGRHPVEPYDWAIRFETWLKDRLAQGHFDAVANYEQQGKDAVLSAPTPEHFLPLLYVLAQRRENDAVSFPVQGFDGGSISMLAVCLGEGQRP
jgi:4,5-DOPA dioxygenase extradiol